MPPPTDRHHRRSVRLRQYDYTQAGAYFITLCTQGRECLFGEIVGDQMVLNDIGQIVATEWERTREIRTEVELDAWVIMPNHLHVVVVISESANEIAAAKTHLSSPTGESIRTQGSIKKSLSSLVQGFKSATTTQINIMRGTPRVPVWQRGLYEHVVRHEADLQRIREYIADNPRRWAEDENNPSRIADP